MTTAQQLTAALRRNPSLMALFETSNAAQLDALVAELFPALEPFVGLPATPRNVLVSLRDLLQVIVTSGALAGAMPKLTSLVPLPASMMESAIKAVIGGALTRIKALARIAEQPPFRPGVDSASYGGRQAEIDMLASFTQRYESGATGHLRKDDPAATLEGKTIGEVLCAYAAHAAVPSF